jgi:hypothetical protein
VFLSRRLAHILCHRLTLYKRDYERLQRFFLLNCLNFTISKFLPQSSNPNSPPPTVSANVCFEDLANCQHHRPTLLVIFGLLHAIIIDCPSALVWTPFEPAELLEGHKSSKSARAVEKENALHSVAWVRVK